MGGKGRGKNDTELLHRLQGLGSPVDLQVAQEDELGEQENRALEVQQVGSAGSALMLELENGRAGIIFEVFVVNHTSTPIYCIDTELRFAWSDPYFAWLPDPKERRTDAYWYAFPGETGFLFPYEVVLNHALVSEESVLTPHRPYTGFLLGTGGLMPKHLRHADRVDATLVITTSVGTESTAPIILGVERSVIREKFRTQDTFTRPFKSGICRPNIDPKGTGLFGPARTNDYGRPPALNPKVVVRDLGSDVLDPKHKQTKVC